jgi:hypothetical protein
MNYYIFFVECLDDKTELLEVSSKTTGAITQELNNTYVPDQMSELFTQNLVTSDTNCM